MCGIVTEGSYGLSLVWVVKWSSALSSGAEWCLASDTRAMSE